MITEVYQNKNVVLFLSESEVIVNYLGIRYTKIITGTIVETLAELLNSIKNNSKEIFKALVTIINIMEPNQHQNLIFDGVKYFAVPSL